MTVRFIISLLLLLALTPSLLSDERVSPRYSTIITHYIFDIPRYGLEVKSMEAPTPQTVFQNKRYQCGDMEVKLNLYKVLKANRANFFLNNTFYLIEYFENGYKVEEGDFQLIQNGLQDTLTYYDPITLEPVIHFSTAYRFEEIEVRLMEQ